MKKESVRQLGKNNRERQLKKAVNIQASDSEARVAFNQGAGIGPFVGNTSDATASALES